MRHLLANVATYALAVGLVIGAALFAWARSAQLVVATEPEVEPLAYASAAAPDGFDWPAFGARVYRANCQNCHTADGGGRGMYPPVRGMPAHLAAPGGRDYLVDVVLYGLATGLHDAPMPPMPELTDAQVAAVTNHVLTRFGDARGARLYVPADVATRRGRADGEHDVGARRPPVPPPAALDPRPE